jgi:hypothetical protein
VCPEDAALSSITPLDTHADCVDPRVPEMMFPPMPPACGNLTMRPVLTLLMLLYCVSLAGAQSTFVSGSLIGEIARFDYIEADSTRYFDPFDVSFNDEAVGFGVSIERSVGERWGVVLEFVKPATTSREDTQQLPISIAIFPPVPPVQIERQFAQKRMSWNTMALLSQTVGDRVELAFLGGVSFTRTKLKQTYSVTVPALALLPPEFVGPSQTSITYSVDPIVGMDARVRLSDNLSVVPGVRLQSAGLAGRSGWLLRPSAAVRWGF